MKFKSVHALLLVVISFITLTISLFTVTGSAMYAQFIHLLQPSPLGTAVIAAGQSQPSESPTLLSSVSTSSSSPSSTSMSLPDIFQKVENSCSNYKYNI